MANMGSLLKWRVSRLVLCWAAWLLFPPEQDVQVQCKSSLSHVRLSCLLRIIILRTHPRMQTNKNKHARFGLRKALPTPMPLGPPVERYE